MFDVQYHRTKRVDARGNRGRNTHSLRCIESFNMIYSEGSMRYIEAFDAIHRSSNISKFVIRCPTLITPLSLQYPHLHRNFWYDMSRFWTRYRGMIYRYFRYDTPTLTTPLSLQSIWIFSMRSIDFFDTKYRYDVSEFEYIGNFDIPDTNNAPFYYISKLSIRYVEIFDKMYRFFRYDVSKHSIRYIEIGIYRNFRCDIQHL